RRKLTHPLPPSPAWIWISTSSMNIGPSGDRPIARCLGLFGLDGLDADHAAAWAAIRKLDDARDFREQRVVFATPHVQARPEAPAALPHEDRSARHEVAVEALDAEPLRVAVAAISRTALSLFVCHDLLTR